MSTRLDLFSIQPPTKGDTWVRDTECSALYGRVSAHGRRTWVFLKSWQSKTIRFKLGDSEVMSQLEARLLAMQALRDLQSGLDPRQRAAKEIKGNMTVAELFDQYYELYAKRSVARPEELKSAFLRHWQPIATKRVFALTPHLVQTWMHNLAAKIAARNKRVDGRAQANRQLNNLRACLNWGRVKGLVRFDDGKNPCEGVDTFNFGERDKVLSPQEFIRLERILDESPGTVSDIIYMALFTMARKGNLLAMEWSELDLTNRRWTIPAHKAKGRKTLHKPLTTFALKVLRRRMPGRFRSSWVFPSEDDPSAHRVNIDAAWREIREKIGRPDLHFHDLRHTMATWLGINGVNAFVIQRGLGHESVTTTQKYTHPHFESVLSALEFTQRKVVGGD